MAESPHIAMPSRATLLRTVAARRAARDLSSAAPASVEPDETTLIQQAREGSREAFGLLYERHRATIARYVAARIRDASDSEDLTEAIFESAWRAMGRYREQGVPFLAWLYRLAHNRVVDHYRALRPTVTLIPEVHESIEDTGAPLDLNIDSADLLKALQSLTGDQRDVIVLRFIQGMSGREVAQAMDKREDAIRALQFRALATLRRILAGEEAHG
ncbi:MAG: sigma-70 family RNA polymerase sigma factor [Chloroflexota bacterium]|nr:sigma-70 family RNA polymerase sigma factor [Chloroflexota bacterium]MDQ6908463.1 sigma-70 family RNA polymerase sigma factor [Chloroflexota bacterium]